MKAFLETVHIQIFYLIPMAVILVIQDVQAQSADSIVNNAADYLIDRLGPAVFLIGIVVSGIALAVGNRDAVRKGIFAIIGGVIILAARAIYNSVLSFAG